MDEVIYIFALLLAFVGVVGSIVPILPSGIFSFAALLLALFTPHATTDPKGLIVWGLVLGGVAVADAVLPPLLTKKFGGTSAGSWGAVIGMVVGILAFPPFGVVVGPLFGAVMGEYINDKSNMERALRSGFVAFVAFLVGTALKFVTSTWIFVDLVVDIVPKIKQLFE